MYWGVLTADFQRLYNLDLYELMMTEGCFDRLVTLLCNLPSQAEFHMVDTSNVSPRKIAGTSRNRPLEPGEYKPIEQIAATWTATSVT